MTTYKEQTHTGRMSLAEVLETLATDGHLPLRFTAYDGSSTGPDDAPMGLELLSPAALPIWPPLRVIWVWPAPTWPGI